MSVDGRALDLGLASLHAPVSRDKPEYWTVGIFVIVPDPLFEELVLRQ